jgi:DNA polymerase III subunit beta
MNFTTDPRKLASAVSWAASRVPSKPTVPILAGMLIELDVSPTNGLWTISFTGFDHEVSATATIDSDSSEYGRCVVSGRLLAELVKSLPPKPVTIDVGDEQMTFTCGPVRATLPLMPAEDYPALPVAPEAIGIVHAEDFAKEVGRILPACDLAMNAGLEALTGVHFAFADDHLIVTATNRYQLATNRVEWRLNPDAAEQTDFPLLIPGGVVASVLKVCDYDGALHIGASEHAVSFTTGARTIVSRALDAKGFPAWGSRVPRRAEVPTVVGVEEVVTALKRAAMVLEPKAPVRLSFDADVLTMHAGSGQGAITAQIDCDHQGAAASLVVNPQFFATAIGSTGDSAELTISGPMKPVLVTAPKDGNYLHIMMPIRSN